MNTGFVYIIGAGPGDPELITVKGINCLKKCDVVFYDASVESSLAKQAGASAIILHPRTRKQMFTGKSNWELIRKVKEIIRIPVIGNGDVIDGRSAKKMLDQTNCDYIMIGRAAIGNPFIFKQITFHSLVS